MPRSRHVYHAPRDQPSRLGCPDEMLVRGDDGYSARGGDVCRGGLAEGTHGEHSAGPDGALGHRRIRAAYQRGRPPACHAGPRVLDDAWPRPVPRARYGHSGSPHARRFRPRGNAVLRRRLHPRDGNSGSDVPGCVLAVRRRCVFAHAGHPRGSRRHGGLLAVWRLCGRRAEPRWLWRGEPGGCVLPDEPVVQPHEPCYAVPRPLLGLEEPGVCADESHVQHTEPRVLAFFAGRVWRGGWVVVLAVVAALLADVAGILPRVAKLLAVVAQREPDAVLADVAQLFAVVAQLLPGVPQLLALLSRVFALIAGILPIVAGVFAQLSGVLSELS
mmetsp:Transcript_11507/g.29130  ORF Transcript_11507/g.29130 Transcript_11507/m.29130 type:complete len:330 (-) Transcript_11507:223-1212(-)